MTKTAKLTKLTFVDDHRHDATERWMRRIIQHILIQTLELPMQDVADFLMYSGQSDNHANTEFDVVES
ncbi:hypothetical protein B2M26_12925 [Ferroacidibacillus organovorans]|uniref:Uncharacterized protein n=1 Tax=Ferroacidibacillus organovorans TaxID=1765683 RepID=A0A1V4ERH6_9BACL|nr:hypothetical protein B2M26_12925 [Ferroacidibacillus organovorans]